MSGLLSHISITLPPSHSLRICWQPSEIWAASPFPVPKLWFPWKWVPFLLSYSRVYFFTRLRRVLNVVRSFFWIGALIRYEMRKAVGSRFSNSSHPLHVDSAANKETEKNRMESKFRKVTIRCHSFANSKGNGERKLSHVKDREFSRGAFLQTLDRLYQTREVHSGSWLIVFISETQR